MSRKAKSIPVNTMADHSDIGIAIERLQISASEEATLNASDEARQSHREDRHSFFLLESGTVTIEIDFQELEIKSPSIIYMHPDQVHRILKFDNVTVSSLAINNESLNPEYRKLLENLNPAQALTLDQEAFSIICEAISFCIKCFKRKNDKLYNSLIKDSGNAIVALITSQYLILSQSAGKTSRFKLIADSFKLLLERNYVKVKSPAVYAQKLNISPPYLNECVKNATGYAVSYHIQQRVTLEAKRLLYHSNKSVKEISSELGYDDYPYFSKLFNKCVGMTPLTFRNKTSNNTIPTLY